jgi:hypothetical protein
MAIIQKNLYLPGQNLTNLAQNVDYNRYQDFKGTITVNFGTVPATVTVKVGTILEVNGNLYAIETADYVFQMDNATHKYLTFTDNPAVDFGSAAAIGTYSAAKQGYYQAGNLIRTLPFYIDQTNASYFYLIDEKDSGLISVTRKYDRIKAWNAGGSGGVVGASKIIFDRIAHDVLGNFSLVNYNYVCPADGFYHIVLNVLFAYVANNIFYTYLDIRKNTNAVASTFGACPASASIAGYGLNIQTTQYLQSGDVIDGYVRPILTNVAYGLSGSEPDCYIIIDRLL